MAVQRVRLDDIPPTRWENGGGLTRQLLAWPDPAQWMLRVSVAEVIAAGPFSVYSGVDRWFAVLDGDGVVLRTAGAAAPVTLSAHHALHRFSGDQATHCDLVGGATRDFNVMARREQVNARVTDLGAQGALVSRDAMLGCFVRDQATLKISGGSSLQLPAMSLAWMNNPGAKELRLEAEMPLPRGWWITAQPKA